MNLSDSLDTTVRVMFVDDEDKMRKLLHICIDWASIGYVPTKDAASAHHALELIPIVRPDVIITDIQMPFINGLDFAQMVMEEYPTIKLVVLTAHEVFDYAQKGVEIGVSSFLLKPVKREELIQKMSDIRQTVIGERKRLYEYETLKEQLRTNLEFLRENYLSNLLVTPADPEILQNNLDYYHIPLQSDTGYYNLLLLTPLISSDVEMGNLQYMQCQELVRSVLVRIQGAIFFTDIHNNLIILCGNKRINLLTYAAFLTSAISEKIGIEIYTGIGTPITTLTDLPQCYKIAYQAAQVARYSNDTACLSTTAHSSISFQMHDYLQNCLVDLSMYLQIPLKEEALAAVTNIYERLKCTSNVPFSDVIVTSLNIVNTILTTLSENDIPYQKIYQTEHLPYTHILKMASFDEIRTYILQLTAFTLEEIAHYTSHKGNALIGSIQIYIDEHLTDPSLSLKKIAAHNYINASYLSRIFKEVTGMTFMDYLISVRIEKAKKLLANPTFRIYEIAEMVGIHDPNYFSKFFKKYAGDTPAGYRDSLQP